MDVAATPAIETPPHKKKKHAAGANVPGECGIRCGSCFLSAPPPSKSSLHRYCSSTSWRGAHGSRWMLPVSAWIHGDKIAFSRSLSARAAWGRHRPPTPRASSVCTQTPCVKPFQTADFETQGPDHAHECLPCRVPVFRLSSLAPTLPAAHTGAASPRCRPPRRARPTAGAPCHARQH